MIFEAVWIDLNEYGWVELCPVCEARTEPAEICSAGCFKCPDCAAELYSEYSEVYHCMHCDRDEDGLPI